MHKALLIVLPLLGGVRGGIEYGRNVNRKRKLDDTSTF